MNEIELKEDLEKGLSTWKIAAKRDVSQCKVRYWLKKYGLRSTIKAGNFQKKSHSCVLCGQTSPSEFYGHIKSFCKKCQNGKRVEEFREKKRKAVLHFGGKCVKCGYAKYFGALDFHHKDSTVKEGSPCRILTGSWERALIELSKCELLCANCHREHHALY